MVANPELPVGFLRCKEKLLSLQSFKADNLNIGMEESSRNFALVQPDLFSEPAMAKTLLYNARRTRVPPLPLYRCLHGWMERNGKGEREGWRDCGGEREATQPGHNALLSLPLCWLLSSLLLCPSSAAAARFLALVDIVEGRRRLGSL